jgi:putative ABC transport system permease protein
MNEFRYALRQLGRRPGFSALVILTLALGIGATTAVFSIVDSVLIRPLPYPDSDRLIAIWHRATFQGITNVSLNLSPPLYLAYAEHNQTFEEFGVYSRGVANVTGSGEPEQVRTIVATYGVLRALAVRPSLGRWFSAQDDTPGTPETAMLTHAYWQRRFGGDPSVLGRVINVDSRPREVIGVMPPGFRVGSSDAELILPQRFDRSAARLDAFCCFGIARLRSGVPLARVDADLVEALTAAGDEFGIAGAIQRVQLAPAVRPLKQDVVGDVGSVLWMLLGAIGVVLVIACLNVANLLLVRAEGRVEELAMRATLGAAPKRIARLLLQESVTLGLIGGLTGLAVAFGALRILVALGPTNLPRLSEITIDANALALTLFVSLASGILFAVVPALRHARSGAGLGAAGRSVSPSREQHRTQNTLVVVQFALAFVLLIGAGLMIRSFESLLAVEPGFTRPEQVQALRVAIPATEVPEPERVIRAQQDMLDRIAAIPGVDSAAFASALPLELDLTRAMPIAVEGVTPENELGAIRRIEFVSPGYFATLGTPLIAGRDFTWADIQRRREVAIVSARMARETWGDVNAALGKRIRNVSAWHEVIGVVADVYEDGMRNEAPAMVYWRAGIFSVFAPGDVLRGITFAIRSERAATGSLLEDVQNAIWSVNRNVPVSFVRTLQQIYEESLASTSFTLVMLGIAGAMALLLGIVGIYGVVSYTVARRNREIGLRLALGARPRDLHRMFVAHGVLLASVGVALGILAAVAVTRLMSSVLFQVSPIDPATYVIGVLVLLGAAALASYVPARRMLAADPLAALKAE